MNDPDTIDLGPIKLCREGADILVTDPQEDDSVCIADVIGADAEWDEMRARFVTDPFALVHLVDVREDDFAIQHPVTERSDTAEGTLFDCALHRWLMQQDGPPVDPGRYIAIYGARQWEFKPVGYPCRVCGYAGTCGEPPGEDCHS